MSPTPSAVSLEHDRAFDEAPPLQVGVKGNTQGFNRGLDCDVIVAEVKDDGEFWDVAHLELANTFQMLFARCAPPVTNQTRSTG